MRPLAVALAALLGLACGSPGASGPSVDEGELVVMRETVDGVTEVRNVSGSRWSEPARLEEIVTLGSEASEDTLFSMPFAYWATDEMVLVADARIGDVRAFDRDGGFLRRYGRAGQGPGEYENLLGVIVAPDGRVGVVTFTEVVFFEPDGAFSHEVRVPLGGDGFRTAPRELRLTPDGHILWATRPAAAPGGLAADELVVHYRALEGGEWSAPVATLEVARRERERIEFPCPGGGGNCVTTLPYQSAPTWRMRSDLVALTGSAERYRFEARRPDGTRIVVEHHRAPAEVDELEQRVQRAALEARVRDTIPGFRFRGSIPERKPAYEMFLDSHDDRFYVLGFGESRWLAENCGPPDDWTPERGLNCYDHQIWIDVFAAAGSYLGTFDRPAEARVQRAFIAADEIWSFAEDAMGNPVVKGYRIVVDEGGS